MLDMGFIPDVEKIVSRLPKIRQTLFFCDRPPEIRRPLRYFLNESQGSFSSPTITTSG